MAKKQFSRLESLLLENFAGYEREEFIFPENINIYKGLNGAGKTSVLKALSTVFFCTNPLKLKNSIRNASGVDHFKITVRFSDGVSIICEKWADNNDRYVGAPLIYEMREGDSLLFSTVVNGVPEKITAVPDVIQNYLKFSNYTSINIHERRGRDKILLIDTTGSENYNLLSSVFNSDVAVKANSLVKEDIKIIEDSIKEYDAKVNYLENELLSYNELTEELLNKIEIETQQLVSVEEKLNVVQKLAKDYTNYHSENITLQNKIVKKLSQLVEVEKLYKVSTSIIDMRKNKEQLTHEQVYTQLVLTKVTEHLGKLTELTDLLNSLEKLQENVTLHKEVSDELKVMIPKGKLLEEKFHQLVPKDMCICENCGKYTRINK